MAQRDEAVLNFGMQPLPENFVRVPIRGTVFLTRVMPSVFPSREYHRCNSSEDNDRHRDDESGDIDLHPVCNIFLFWLRWIEYGSVPSWLLAIYPVWCVEHIRPRDIL